MNMQKYNSIRNWADKVAHLENRPMGTFVSGIPVQTGIMISTDLYEGPYPDEKTRFAVEQVKKAAARRSLRCEVHPMMIAVYVYCD